MLKTFDYHKPSEDGLKAIAQLRESFSLLHELCTVAAPKSRELSAALTHLEEAAMWAIKAVVINDPNSVAQTKCGSNCVCGEGKLEPLTQTKSGGACACKESKIEQVVKSINDTDR